MLAPVLLLMAQAASAAPASAPADEIVVVGQRIEEELATCLARSCPPKEEIELSLQLSVNQFASGRYTDARNTLQRAIRRNRDHAAELPGPVSMMYATLASVAEHQGDPRLWRQSARNNVEVLRQHVGESHVATLGQELAFADSMVGLGTLDSAGALYRAVQRKAADSGNAQFAAGAAFRRAWLALLQEHDRDALRLADEAVGLAGADDRLMRDLREILRTRIAVREGDNDAVDALATRLRQAATDPPRLLFASGYEDINADDTVEVNRFIDSDLRLADVGYWIRPDGRTADIEILRNNGLGQWAPGILRQIRSRRYVPFDGAAGNPGLYRIERFTVRATKGDVTGSHIEQRRGDLTIHVVDLTETEAMGEAHRRRLREAAAPVG
ncbi:hypothetical protein [Croceibacterium ferulae]|uniref:hypothetical protein n=1 Tax=Croceibacterium ferulae TaxID=1854641 RepID=UPI000EB581A2|nr:hypothetical protein [Croceibacterium ferulae]